MNMACQLQIRKINKEALLVRGSQLNQRVLYKYKPNKNNLKFLIKFNRVFKYMILMMKLEEYHPNINQRKLDLLVSIRDNLVLNEKIIRSGMK